MNKKINLSEKKTEEKSVNIGLVGEKSRCESFLDLINKISVPYMRINVTGVHYTGLKPQKTNNAEHSIPVFKDLNGLLAGKIDGILDLSNDKDILMEIIRLKRKDTWIMEYSLAKNLPEMLKLGERIGTNSKEAHVKRMVSEFLTQHLNERIVVLDPNFKITDANDAYLKAVCKSKQEVIGNYCYKVTHKFSSPCSQWQAEIGCPLIETLKTGQSAHVIHEHQIGDNEFTYCDLETYPIKINSDGEVLNIIEIWRDITNELSPRWETRLHELKSNLNKLVQEDRMVSLGKLAASCVHELNNPIQGLLTYCDLMLSMVSERVPDIKTISEVREYLSTMSNELERCGNIVSGLLSFARESPVEPGETDLNEVINSVISLTGHKLELQNISLNLDLSKRPLNIRGDIKQLQQCFLNLIFNAIEAMKDSGRLEIISGTDKNRERAEILIKDTGCGIPEKYQKNIFDPFFTTKGQGEGTGLGLSIVYGIIKSHEGEISIESKKGSGTTFIISFPVIKSSK